MSDAPERIFASRDEQDGWRWPRASKFPEQGPRENIEYRRADLPPTLAEALAVPEVKALVEALTPTVDTKAAYMGVIKDPDTKRMVSWTAIKMVMKMITDRAALRAVEDGE